MFLLWLNLRVFLFPLLLLLVFPFSISRSGSLPLEQIHSGGGGITIVNANVDVSVAGELRTSLPLLLGAEDEETNNKNTSFPSLILAQHRTRRRDPANRFKTYTDGWNITNSHYWTSVALSAAPSLVIAVAWFILFGISLSIICICYCCCKCPKSCGYSRLAYVISLISLILFTLAAIVGCIVLYTGQAKFHNKTSATLDYIVDQADATYNNLRNVSNYLFAAKNIGIESIVLPTHLKNKIDDIQTNISSFFDLLQEKTASISHKIHHYFDIIGWALIVLAAVMLLLTLLGFLFSIIGLQCLVRTFVVIGWILVTCTFLLCAVFLLLHNVIGDTCVALEEWVKNPTAHTTLDDILPCVDNETAQETLSWTNEVAFGLVKVIDRVIKSVNNGDYDPDLAPLYFNQSGPLMPVLCNPLHSDLAPRECAHGEVDFNNASGVWQNYVCEVSPKGICTTPGRLTPAIFTEMTAAVNISYGLHHYAPFLVRLVDCTFLRETVTDISGTYCPGLRRYSERVYIGLVTVSAAAMMSLIFWLVYGRERRHRVNARRPVSRHSEIQI